MTTLTNSHFLSLNQFMINSYSEDKTLSTHTSIFNPRGSFYISRDKLENFYKLYSDKISNGITEIPEAYSMLRFDFDIKKSIEDYKYSFSDKKRFYEIGEIHFLIEKINKKVKQLTDCNDSDLLCCLLEKDIYKKNETSMSGGFHLQYPKIFIRNDVINLLIIKPIEKEIFNETSLTFDGGIYKNPWLMYGATKSETLKPYILTKIFNINMNEMTVFDAFQNYDLYDSESNKIKITPENVDNLLPRILSINSENRKTYEVKNEYIVKLPELTKKVIKKSDDRSINEKVVECRKLLSIISSSRVDDYHSWINLGWCLFSIFQGCEEGLELWDEKSKESEKYDCCVCELEWVKMRIGNYTVSTLHMFAREDNIEIYNQLFKKKDCWLKELIFNFTDLNCAENFKQYIEGEIFYTESHKWIIFNNETKFWSFNNTKDSLIYPVSRFFTTKIKEFQIEFTKSYNPNDKDDSEFLKEIGKVHKKVGMSKFSNGVISQLQALLTVDNDIMEKFDKNPYLIAFKDGKVIDLKNNANFRNIIKEDFIITHTGYNLPERDNNYIELMKNIVRSLVKSNDDLKVVLTALSCFIYGGNINELFFVFTGSGGNGKGMLDKSLFSVLGNYYKTINITQLTTYEKDGNRANSELAKCQYARCVITSEPDTDKGAKLITPTIKKWTGNDLLTCRELHGKTFQFEPRFTLGIQTNGVPDLSINDGGIQRRMKIIELPYKFVEDKGQMLNENEKYGDSSLKDLVKTPEYRNAMLFLLIDTWIENNGKFYENSKVQSFTNEYFDSQNPIKLWFNENYTIDDNGRISSTTLLEEYRTNTEDYDMTSTKFGKLLKEFCQCIKSSGLIKFKCKKIESNENQDRIL